MSKKPEKSIMSHVRKVWILDKSLAILMFHLDREYLECVAYGERMGQTGIGIASCCDDTINIPSAGQSLVSAGSS